MRELKGLTIEELGSIIKEANTLIKEQQSLCEHKRIKYKYGSNTGNYCSADDNYWVEITCLDCSNRDTYYEGEDGYKMKYIGVDLKVTEDEWQVLSKFGKV